MAEGKPRSRKKVLIADDQASVLEMLSAAITEETDYVVFTAATSDEATAGARAEKPDLVILDLVLPPENGYVVCQAIKGDPETRHIIVVMLTAMAQEWARERSLDAGADEYLTKPFSPYALVLKLHGYLRSEAGEVGFPRTGP